MSTKFENLMTGLIRSNFISILSLLKGKTRDLNKLTIATDGIF